MKRLLLMAVMVIGSWSVVNAQIVIGGNVYGGGNEGDVEGGTTVTVRGGDLNNVFGGACMANVGGNALVNIDGEHASSYILINRVYGGNDISGEIGTDASKKVLPAEVLSQEGENQIDNTWDAFVRISTKTKADGTEDGNAQKIYIGQLFGGGNGDYDYTSDNSPYKGKQKPELGKTYLEVVGGSIVYAYGGGNNATVTDKTVICVDNPSKVVNSIIDTDNPNANTDSNKGEVGELLTTERFRDKMGINTGLSYPSSDAFQIGRFFGGNNKTEMAIMPTWNLKSGKIRNLYSGGNRGAMTNREGLLLEIMATSNIVIDNVYGGCRMADVHPLVSGTLESGNYQEAASSDIQLHDASGNDDPHYKFPAGLSARVLIRGGDINNVYGGNDVTGDVTGGNAVGIYHSIKGDVYGGGNGSYSYTDNVALKDHDIYGDLYYGDFMTEKGYTSSVEALNAFRPNAEAVSIRVIGTDEAHPTVVGGAIYCGGNSATLRNDDPNKDAAAELKIGSYVIADKVFLGNNGANMVTDDVLRHYAYYVNDAGEVTENTSDHDFSQINLASPTTTNGKTQFDLYMDGVAMKIKPRVVFDNVSQYVPYSTKFGSFFCGGNVGSMDIDGVITVDFNDKVVIFDKVVGGSNEANVYAKPNLNVQHLGGLLGAPEEGTGNKLVLNFGGLKIQPKRWVNKNDKSQGLEWNIIKSSTGEEITPTGLATGGSTADDLDRRFKGGNVYGGCYQNGHVNGNVVINLNASLVDRKGEKALFDEVEENEGEAKLYGADSYNITERHSGVLLSQQGMDPLGRALNVFGGGYGGDSEIWGGVTINLKRGYTFQVFGGGEMGSIGKADSYNTTTGQLEYTYNPAYSTCINLGTSTSPVGTYRGDTDAGDGVVDDDDMADCEFIYGGSFEGLIVGDTRINLGNGRIFNSFAGSCNADIIGHTSTYVGQNSSDDTDPGFPWIRDHIYGGNDLGGRILGVEDFTSRVSTDILGNVYNPKNKEVADVLKASAYTEYKQGHVEYIFGGCYGDYDYTNPHYKKYTYTQGDTDATETNMGTPRENFHKPYLLNAFVNIKPGNNSRNAIKKVYGAGQGHAWNHASDADRDKMQDRSYVLIDIPQTYTAFQNMEVFGAGAWSGLGMRNGAATTVEETTIPALTPDVAKTNVDGVTASTVIDLMRGQIKDVFGASFKEGITRRTIVNVPASSTIHLNRIFGGAYGESNDAPCDVYEANVNYRSATAIAAGSPDDLDEEGNQTAGAIYGGNNNSRRTLYSRVNIYSKVRQNENGYTARVFGAGYGKDTWAQYTEVNLENGADIYEVYGGGYGGMVLNKESVDAWPNLVKDLPTGYTDQGLNCDLVKANDLDNMKCNANVHIKKGAWVGNYAYGGGLGKDATVSGSTYIDLLGGAVKKDLYAGGTSGAVMDKFKVGAKSDTNPNGFTATTNAYIKGGTVRNVYGGGWEGHVGYTDMKTTTTSTGVTNVEIKENIPGKTNVVIGVRNDQASVPAGYGYDNGVPAIQRNAYGGGEGGSVFGETNLTLNNGYIGYVYDASTQKYEEKVHDETWTDHVGKDRLSDCGNLFGGGYDDNSSVDHAHVTVWGGIIRNSIFGGGEIATIGRGKTKESGADNKVRELDGIYYPGSTQIKMYNGHVKRNIFGGGKGYNILGYGGTRGFYTDGYVFGQTEVLVHGGEIGTEAGVADGDGNVFGGGDVGYVYSKGFFSAGTKTYKNTGSPNHIYYYDDDGKLTEDCKVVISPMLQLKPGKTASYKNVNYSEYDYVPTEYLNTLESKTSAGWMDLYTGDKNADGSTNPDDPVERGILIHNAVFAGGNVSSNSENYNNATTVFGNTTATLYDVYHRDFITVGTEHTGGLYGGGNLSVVNGYRELNITNYGTDYYGLNTQITLEEYGKLTNRERAYFELQYLCMQNVTINGKDYKQGDKIPEDEYNKFDDAYKNESYWKQYGFCSIYAGRLLNTIQRADFCGVFGSRLVLQGAKDRVADVGDATEYTINRIGELSLNQQRFTLGSNDNIHGNYFGIYSVVNYLGNLTSDVHFVADKRRYVDNGQTYVDNDHTYFEYKKEHLNKRDRNNGTSYNQVALASGVYLEITSENSTPTNKIYGDITGVVELDLINVKKDIEGGGYVYARNEHGQWDEVSHENTLLSPYNMKDGDEALTKKIFTYSTTELFPYQTSGNFIHRSKRIVDDCYPNNGVYIDDKGVYKTSPAHYWFIKGEVYIYDQKVSAYAGSANAYRKEVKIPLTITAGSNGKLQLLNVQPSLYAYYGDESRTTPMTSDGVKVDNESMTYHLNDVITWWDWHQLADNEKKYFVKDTYINVDSCNVDGTPYPAGTYVLENDRTFHSTTAWDVFQTAGHTVTNARGIEVTGEDLAKLFRSSNNISHNTGYVLTFDMNSPKDWNDWYTPVDNNSGLSKIRKEDYDRLSAADKEKYREGPTYTLNSGEQSGLYGQKEYVKGDIITEEVYRDYTSTVSQMSPQPSDQASAELAYLALEDVGNVQAGSTISKTEYDALPDKSNYDPAMVCVNTIQIGEEEYILMGELVSGADTSLDALAQKFFAYNNSKVNADKFDNVEQARDVIMANLSRAYCITSGGLYGGQYFQSGINYGALKSWCSLSDSREKFGFNYDALDVLIDPEYHGEGYIETYYHSPYSDIEPVEYEASYTGGVNGTETLTYTDGSSVTHNLTRGDAISNYDYENYIPNEQLHYTRIQVENGEDTQTVYVVLENIINKGTPYAKGQDISEKDYNALSDENKDKVAVVTFQKSSTGTEVRYYCYEDYTPSQPLTTLSGIAGKQGSIIASNVFRDDVPNKQKDFTIHGTEPTETTTLYVSRESNAKDVMSEKVITVVYQYTYYESDDEGEGVSLVNELHVVNIHLKLESGAPEIGPLNVPPAVLPGNTLGLKAPSVNPGLYDILVSGWEIYFNESDAENHLNGKPFFNNRTPLYWYQNQKAWLAFYSKTYLGKTYSNYVPLTVANYHDIDAVMKDKEHHLYVDHPDVMRNSKIYIDDRNCESDDTKSELDLLKDFFDLSVLSSTATTDPETGLITSGPFEGHAPLDNHVAGGADLEFILNSDVSPKKYTAWTPIGSDDTQCFRGNLHGDGYTISGLDKSLFGKLCGSVYNLGVTGSFTSAGVVDKGEGYVENCWINTSGTPNGSVKAVFGTTSEAGQVVNCYYPNTKNYAAGDARAMTETEFYNGTVAYNLNGFYLNKRYYDHSVTGGSPVEYNYLKQKADGTLQEDMSTGYYPASYAYYPLDPKKISQYGKYGYVEDRYTDGDFIYAGGTIPEAYDERMRVVTDGTTSTVTYAPIWPDDYIYFGQTLTFDYNSSRPHDEQPTHVLKSSGRLPVSNLSNRVYRAPAYYQSKDLDVAHFNLWANLAAYSWTESVTATGRPAYPNMTAIDFFGHEEGTAEGAYKQGYNGKLFYQPLLDNDEGLLSIVNNGETPNLLVYAPEKGINTKTDEVLTYFDEPSYSTYYIDDDYRRAIQAPTASINGHLVQSNLKASTDHLLVDMCDFNCPIGYSFAKGKRMWYQRRPERYVSLTDGWETVSLPFTAELVTTQQKGEITHFYSGSLSVDENGTKVGHEYWLREYVGKKAETGDTFTAVFNYPTATTSGDYKNVGNTFLWDYYYKANEQQDANRDKYQTYYATSRGLAGYPFLSAAVPYIIGFPGKTYYEFDLSGEWIPKNTADDAPEKLAPQLITFASYPSNEDGFPILSIGVSDTEQAGHVLDGYTFKPNYSSKVVTGYLLNSSGNSFNITEPTAAVPFRPYFVAGSASAPATRSIQHIIFDSDDSSFAIGDEDPSEGDVSGGLLFSVKRHAVVVTSSLRREADVRIVNTRGQIIASFDIQPGETIETPVHNSGVYIIQAAGGHYTKKLAVK